MAVSIGDILYRAAVEWLRLPGNTTTTRKFLRQTGTGTSAAAPAWDTILEADIASALSNTTSAHNALSNVVSNIISAGGGGVSVTSTELSAVSAQAASALSNAVSVLNASLSNLTSSHNALSNRVSVNSATGGTTSVTSNEVSAVSAQALSAHNVLSNAVSALSDAHTSLVNRVSQNSATGGTGSVTSTEVSAVSAQAASALSNAVSVLNATISDLTSSHNALSNTVSSLTGGALEQTIFKANDETRTGASTGSAAMSVDASLAFSVTSAATYAVEGQLLLSSTSATGDFRFGWSVPTSVLAYWGPAMLSAIAPLWDGQVQTGTPLALLRETNTWGIAARGDGAVTGAYFRATFRTGATAGTVRLTHGVETSTPGVNTVMGGSFLRVLKVG